MPRGSHDFTSKEYWITGPGDILKKINMKKDKITEVLSLMSDSIEKGQIELYNKLVNEKCFDEVKGHEEFYLGLIYPYEQFISGLIKSEISTNKEVVFIFKNSQFIEDHFTHWISRIEGSACCADKTRTIIRGLIDFYKVGNKIEFDYTQQYTFHLPKIIFKTHDDIISFYDAIKNLNYGNPTKYLLALKKITEDQKSLK